jgi:hypothetical protein
MGMNAKSINEARSRAITNLLLLEICNTRCGVYLLRTALHFHSGDQMRYCRRTNN